MAGAKTTKRLNRSGFTFVYPRPDVQKNTGRQQRGSRSCSVVGETPNSCRNSLPPDWCAASLGETGAVHFEWLSIGAGEDTLDDGEAATIALIAELGCSRLSPAVHCREAKMDRPMSRRVERQAQRLHRMMERLGLRPGTLARLHDGRGYAEAHNRCLSCNAGEACNRWLAEAASAQDRPKFCRNLPLLEACLQSEPEHGGKPAPTSEHPKLPPIAGSPRTSSLHRLN